MLGALEAYRELGLPILWEQGLPFTTIGFYMTIISLICLAINPVLVFIGFYLVGRKIDLKARLPLFIVLPIVGACVGNLLGHVTITLIIEPELLLYGVCGGLNPTSFLQTFFVAFTALAIAHIRRQ